MKVLVTGSSGFIGKHLVSKLKEDKGISLILPSRVGSDFPEENVSQFIFGPIDSSTDWAQVLKDTDAVIHLLGIAHNKNLNSKAHSKDLKQINVEATANLASQAVKAGVKRFIFLSSIKVNGEETLNNKPFKAEDSPQPQDLYGKSKLEAERVLKEVVEDTNTELVIIRPVLVYGPGVKGNFLSLIKWIKIGIPLPLRTINNKRSFVSIKNLVDFIIICLKHPSAANQIFLVCDQPPISSYELVKNLSYLLKKRPLLISFPEKILRMILIIFRKKDVARKILSSLEVNIDKNLDILGWKPTQSTNDALGETAQYFLENEK